MERISSFFALFFVVWLVLDLWITLEVQYTETQEYTDIDKSDFSGYDTHTYKECARDKLDDRTATCREGKVLRLERWGYRGYLFTVPSLPMGLFFALL